MKQSNILLTGFCKQSILFILYLCFTLNLSAQKNKSMEDPNAIRFSQVNVTHQLWDKNFDRFGEKDAGCFNSTVLTMMLNGNYKGFPAIDVVIMPDGEMTSLDNRRLLAAKMIKCEIEVIKHHFSDPLPKEHQNRIKQAWYNNNPGEPTWGSFVQYRVSEQDKHAPQWSKQNEYGSYESPKVQLNNSDHTQYKNILKQLNLESSGDDHDPNEPPPGGAARIRANTQTSTDIEHIRQIKRDNGDIPGGILLNEVSGKIKGLSSVRSASFDFERSAFIINGEYTFETWLSPDEVAELAKIAASYDRRLGVLSQSEGINLNPKGALMRTLTAADTYLGPIAYGYDMCGNALENAPDGYENAYENATDEARWWLFNWDEVMRQGDAALRGQQPRLFLEFKTFTFSPDLRNHTLIADQMDLQINYQVFTTDWCGQETFNDEPVEKTEPHVAKAIEHFRMHYTNYESRNVDLLRTRHIAATFALLKYLIDSRVNIENWGELIGLQSLEIPYAYGSYANLSPDSDQVRWAAKALAALEWVPSIFISEDAELRLARLMLQYAMESQNIEKIAQYRKEIQDLLGGLSEKSNYFSLRQTLLVELNYIQANGIAGKIDFANRYAKSHPAMAKNYYRAAAEYYEKAITIEPEAFVNYLQLGFISNKLGEAQKEKKFRKIGLELAIQAADKGDAYAQYSVGVAYLDDRYGARLPIKAETYLRKAADQGYPDAALQLGYLLGFTNDHDKNLKEAVRYFSQAAEAGQAEARYCLASCIYSGQGMTKDLKKSYELMRLSAEANYPDAQLNLGVMLKEGIGTKANRSQARLWIKRAADQGLASAQRELSQI